MLKEIKNYEVIDDNSLDNIFGNGGISMGLVTCFAVVAIVTVIVYKIYQSKTGDVTLPGGFKFKFTT